MTGSKIHALITGATGMVGEGVLHVCLQHPLVESVLVINRKPCGVSHPKLKEIIHQDFFDLSPLREQLTGYNACYFCLGVTSVGKNERDYTKFTYTLTMHVATLLSEINKELTFCYVSGAGTDSSEKGRLMWARVKGKAENDLAKLPFRQVFVFRPGIIKPIKGMKFTHSFYKFFGWLFWILRKLNGYSYVTLEELGLAMIHCISLPDNRRIMEVRDIIDVATSTKRV